jgi:type IV secretory pathway VirB10-like protein
MLDYLETGLFRGRPEAAPRPQRRSRPAGPPAPSVRRVLADSRVLAVAAIVAVALAILAGTSLPLHSTQAGPGRPSVTPSMTSRLPGTSAPPSPAPPSTARPSATPPASPPTRPPASPGAAGSNGAAVPQARPAVTTGPAAGASPAASARSTRRAARAAAGAAVVVTFTVTSRGTGIFEGEVRIVNGGTSPLANWQVSVALPGDRVVAVANASGFVIHGILLLEPASGATPVPPQGGVLNVFFVAAGPQPVSGACTYNQSPCG